MLRFNFNIAWRNIRKHKVFSSINIIGLAISMACCLAIAMYVWTETHYDSFHQHGNEVYRITSKQNQAGKLYHVAVTPAPLAEALKKDFPEVQQTVRIANWSGTLRNNGKALEVKQLLATDNSFFSVFSFTVLKGNARTALLAPDELVLTEKVAAQYFGKDWPSLNVLGTVFSLNGQDNFKVAAVVANPPVNSSIQFDALLPMQYLLNADPWAGKWESNNYHTYVQVQPNAAIGSLKTKLASQFKKYKPETGDVLQLQPLREQYLYSQFDFFTDWGKRSDIKYIRIFSGIGLLLLIIACVNFINLSTARSMQRSMEVGIRKVNGASRQQLIRQFLSEALLMALIAGLTAVMLLAVAQPLFQKVTGIVLSFSIGNGIFIAFLLLYIVVIGLMAGIYPAFILSSFRPAAVLKGSRNSRNSAGGRKSLVVLQFAIAIGMIICTSFMYRQLQFMQESNLGFNSSQVIKMGIGGSLRDKIKLLKQDLDKEASIEATTLATMSLANVDNSSDIEWEGMQPNEKFLITQANADPDFIPALGMQLAKGNNFKPQHEEDTINQFILNETAVKMMGATNDNIIGKRLTFWGAKGSVVGVVKDFHFKPLTASIEPFIFRYQPWAPYFHLFVKTAPGQTAVAIKRLQEHYRKYVSDSPLEFSFLNESINALYKEDKRTAAMVLLFACFTIFVACLGLFGLAVYASEQRIKEIGIRKVLGATVFSVVQLLSRDFAKLVLMAMTIAVPIAWYASNRWLQQYAYRINLHWWVFAVAGAAVLLIALLTVSFQAVKAAVANPVKSLRTE